jgi:hypothetical protein
VKNFVYLVQGTMALVASFHHLHNERSDLVTLTYDFEDAGPAEGGRRTFFAPNSTWSQGRNILLESVKKMDYRYFIFIDDDMKIIKGSFEEFEKLLLLHCPSVGLPLVDEIKASHRYKARLSHQAPIALDQILQAYSKGTVEQAICLPFVGEFDDLSWWLGCEINQFLILRYYGDSALQFNSIEVSNTNHSWYDSTPAAGSSKYVGGITAEGTAKAKAYIVDNFGPQPSLPNSLFHNSRFPRLVFSRPLGDSLAAALRELCAGNVRRSFRTLREPVLRFLTHNVYRLFNRS